MYKSTLAILGQYAQDKSNLVNSSKRRYIVASALAGIYVGLGVILIMTIGGSLYPSNPFVTNIVMGLSFGVALSLVLMTGSELFTGTNLIMAAGVLDKQVSWKSTSKVWLLSYVGNFLGSILIACLFYMTGLIEGPAGDFFLKIAEKKIGGDFVSLLFKGILCNTLVCLAVLTSLKMKSEAGKLIMIFWCLFAFITSGYEHSIANMSIFSLTLMMDHSSSITLTGALGNLIPVTIGNFIGGAVLLGGGYYYLGRK